MMRLALALAVAAALVTGCGERRGASPGEETFGPSDLTPTEREAFVYAAVIEHMTAEDGQSSGFEVIYVLDHSVEGVSDPDGPEGARSAIPQDVQIRIQEELALLPPIRFIADPDEVIGTQGDRSQVQNGGILITLGPIPSGEDRVEVEASSYIAALAATWQTWVLERRGLRWEVTGTTGPVAIS
jgi:hypothetical protein